MSVLSEALTGKSLLDVIETRFQDTNRGETVTRIIFGASFGEGSNAEKVTALAQEAKATAEKVSCKCRGESPCRITPYNRKKSNPLSTLSHPSLHLPHTPRLA